MQRTVDLIYFNAGGGHRAAAQALEEMIRMQGRPWRVRLVNLFEVFDPHDRFRRITGAAPEAYYNRRLARGWTIGLGQELKLLQRAIRFFHPSLVTRLRQHWRGREPDLVVSLVPNFNRAICEAVRSELGETPFVTVMTDMADLPPHFWIEPGQRQHIVCGTPHAMAQARAAGYDDSRLFLASGMLLRPSFYAAPGVDAADRDAQRRALGLDSSRPLGIVMFGGQGSTEMLRIARELRDRQLIFMCGRNTALAERLRLQQAGAPHRVVGFTQEVARYLRMADFFIGKPGPGSLSEAVHLGLPVITVSGAGTMPQERYNATWVRDNGVGLVLASLRGIAAGVAELVGRLPEFQTRVRGLENRAIFEVPEIFATLMAQGATASPSPAVAEPETAPVA